MNRWIIISIFLTIFLASCEKVQIGRYDLDRYVYFTMTEEQDTVLAFSQYVGAESYDLYFEVNLMGRLLTTPLAFRLAVVDTLTTASPEQYDFDTQPLFGANQDKDTIKVTLKKTPVLKEREDTLTIAVVANENFNPGFVGRRYIKICFNDKDAAPLWWDATFQIYFGGYSRVKLDALIACIGITDFTGVGEPLLRKYAIELKKYIKDNNITDNGKEIIIPVN